MSFKTLLAFLNNKFWELFGNRNDDQTKNIWTQLKELNVSYNYLEGFDNSLKSLPNLEYLDVSHNNIKHVDEIQLLERLIVLNLSYNQLEHLPLLNIITCRFLMKLYIRNNNLEDLEGLECFFNLEELDVSYNCLSEYHVLNPLGKLKSLKKVSLTGNPLFFHKKHQSLVINYVHPALLKNGFCLNGKWILIGEHAASRRNNDERNYLNPVGDHHQTSINAFVGDVDSVLSDVGCHIVHTKKYLDNDASDEGCNSSCSDDAILFDKKEKRKNKSGSTKKAKNTREVFINDPEDSSLNAVSDCPKQEEGDIPSHIKAKQLIEARRKDHGVAWLIPDDSFKRLASSHIPKVPANTPVFIESHMQGASQSVLPSETIKGVIRETDVLVKARDSVESDSKTIVDEELKEILDLSIKLVNAETEVAGRPPSQQSDDIEVINNKQGKSEVDETIKAVGKVENTHDSEYDFYKPEEQTYDDSDDDVIDSDTDEESENMIFVVEKKDKLRDSHVFIKCGSNYIKEKDFLSGKVLDTLDLNTLSSVKLMTQNKPDGEIHEISLKFDTLRTSRQQRLYVVDDLESANNILKLLQPFADAKILKEVTLGALECLKCMSQFSKQMVHRKIFKSSKPFPGSEKLSSSYDSSKGFEQEMKVCPNCQSHMLVEMESIPLPSSGQPPPPLVSMKSVEKDNISVGSSSSGSFLANLFATKISPILKRKNMTSSDAQNQDELKSNQKESGALSDTETKLRRVSSDVTIISNPSQSNIAVVSEFSQENDLHAIQERFSLSSLSPPVSQHCSIIDMQKAQGDQTNHNVQVMTSVAKVRKEDEDFYSLNDSYEQERDDKYSSNSDVYLSPTKSTASESDSEDEFEESSYILKVLGEKEIMKSDTFIQMDSRLKLHLEINIFGDNEELEACLQTSIVPLSTSEEFNGIFVMSSKKIYVIKFLEKKSDYVEKTVQTVYSGSLQQLKEVKVILGNQGIVFHCGPATHVYTLIIRDADICNSFFSIVTEMLKRHQHKVKFILSNETSVEQIKNVVSTVVKSDVKTDILLHLFVFWNSDLKEPEVTQSTCIVTTQEDIFALKIIYEKKDNCTDLEKVGQFHYTYLNHQKISDLISLQLKPDFTRAQLTFLNESSSTENQGGTVWNVKTHTKASLFSLISALKEPWEKIFGIPLQLSFEKV